MINEWLSDCLLHIYGMFFIQFRSRKLKLMLKDKLKRLILPFVLIAFIPAYSEANDRANIPAPEWHGAVEKQITGKITQQGGQPLAGATIMAKSSGASTT
jgi:hypothetical protein